MQALQRRLALKQRDGGVDRLILVVAGTPRNRQMVREVGIGLRTPFRSTRMRWLRALREGRDPGANSIIFL